jgi:hypothetical protein
MAGPRDMHSPPAHAGDLAPPLRRHRREAAAPEQVGAPLMPQGVARRRAADAQPLADLREAQPLLAQADDFLLAGDVSLPPAAWPAH